MNRSSWMTFGAGVLVGTVGPACLLGGKAGRRVLVEALKGSLRAYDWAVARVETVREDVSDLVAEARHELEPTATSKPAESSESA